MPVSFRIRGSSFRIRAWPINAGDPGESTLLALLWLGIFAGEQSEAESQSGDACLQEDPGGILPECAGDETWHNEDVGTWGLNPKEVLAPCDSESSWGVSKWSRWWRSSKSLGLCQQCSDWTVGKPFGEICGSTSRWKLVSFKVSFRGSARSRCRAAETSMCYWWICV